MSSDPDKIGISNTNGLHSPSCVYYGWVIVCISLLNLLVFYGVWYSYSVFLVSFTREFGWDRTRTSSIFSLFMLVIAFTSPLIGYGVDRLGSRRVLSFGSLMMATGLFLCSKVNSITAFYLAFGVIVGLGGSSISLVGNSRAITSWFIKRRGLATGIATSGIGLGMMIFVPTVQVWVLKYGWRSAFLMLALLTAFILIPVNIILMRNNPKDLGLSLEEEAGGLPYTLNRSDPKRKVKENAPILLKSLKFWRIFLIFFSGGFVVQAVLIHQVAIATDAGFHQIVVVTALGAVGIFGTIGRTVWGLLSDRLGRDKAYLFASTVLVFGLGAILAAKEFHSFIALYIYVILFGLGYSAIAPLNLTMAADIYSGEQFGFIYGFLFMGTGIGAALGPLVSGFIFDRLSDYSLVFCLITIILILSNMLLRQAYSESTSRR